mgnify:CR=1 FL=1
MRYHSEGLRHYIPLHALRLEVNYLFYIFLLYGYIFCYNLQVAFYNWINLPDLQV